MNRLGVLLLVTTVLLTIIGVFILYESSSYTALLNIGDKYFFIKNQLTWALLGLITALIVARINRRLFEIAAVPALLVTILLLLIVFIPGVGLELKGAHRWIDLGFVVLQPSELLKITLTMYLALWLSKKETNRLLAFLILFFVCVGLVAVEPDMGSATIVAVTAVTMYFMSGVKLREMGVIFLILAIGAVVLIKMEPYRVARLASFTNFDTNDLSTTSYHIKQILIAFGFGGIGGAGVGNSIQKYAYLPENTTDSIFAIYAEETGFIGSILLMGLFIVQMFLGYSIASRSQDMFNKLLAIGITTYISIQTIFNLASQAVLVPLTGVPLPFISYGGSSMVINYISIGILLNIARQLNMKPALKKHKRV